MRNKNITSLQVLKLLLTKNDYKSLKICSYEDMSCWATIRYNNEEIAIWLGIDKNKRLSFNAYYTGNHEMKYLHYATLPIEIIQGFITYYHAIHG